MGVIKNTGGGGGEQNRSDVRFSEIVLIFDISLSHIPRFFNWLFNIG